MTGSPVSLAMVVTEAPEPHLLREARAARVVTPKAQLALRAPRLRTTQKYRKAVKVETAALMVRECQDRQVGQVRVQVETAAAAQKRLLQLLEAQALAVNQEA
jgi:hypothetical protein